MPPASLLGIEFPEETSKASDIPYQPTLGNGTSLHTLSPGGGKLFSPSTEGKVGVLDHALMSVDPMMA